MPLDIIIWLFYTLILFLIVYIFVKILGELDSIYRRNRLNETIKFIKDKLEDLDEIKKGLRNRGQK